MITRLLNLGFIRKKGNTYVCEDIVIEVRGDKIYVFTLDSEITIDELEHLMLAD